MKRIKSLLPYLVIIVVVILIRLFIATPVVVIGSSMEPTLAAGEIAILNKLDKTYQRFDIVVFKYQNDKLVKRIIGLPGETVCYQNGVLYINGEVIDDEYASITADFELSSLGYDTIPANTYLVLGDNRTNSLDSRLIGVINQTVIEGKPIWAIYPFNKIGKVE